MFPLSEFCLFHLFCETKVTEPDGSVEVISNISKWPAPGADVIIEEPIVKIGLRIR